MKKNNKIKENNGKRTLLIFVAAFLALALVFGATLGIITAIKRANSVVSYDGVTMTKPVASFFISRFKVEYISALRASGVNALDTPAFWASNDDSGEEYGEKFKALAVQYLKEIVSTAYLFDRYSGLTKSDKEKIQKTCADVLEFQAGGDKDRFDEMAAQYGFDYASFCDAVELLYKSTSSYSAIYGADGTGLYNDPASCEKYLSEYSHVQLIFIRTEKKLTTDSDGKSILVDMTDAEKEEKLKIIDTLAGAIDAIGSGADGQMSPAMFEIYLDKKYNDGDTEMNSTGYYFHEDSETTAEFAEAFPEVVKLALKMKNGQFEKVVTKTVDEENLIGMDAVCFIYKYAPVAGAYKTPSLERWFSDFYSDASARMFVDSVSSLIADAVVSDKLAELDVIAIPKNTDLVPRFE
jgi:hypothetical protein